MKKAREIFGKPISYFSYIGMAITFVIMMMTTVDVILRKVSTFSILGSFELTEMGMVVVVFLGLASLQAKGGHVRVDMFTRLLPGRLEHFISFVILLAESVFYAYMTYAAMIRLTEYLVRPVYTGVLRISYIPFYSIMSLGLACFSILLLMDSIIHLIDCFYSSKQTLPQKVE